MTTPHISILIDTYNHERYIEQAIVSVLEQDFPAKGMEIVVVDDGSTDGTPSIVEKFLPRLRYIRKKNGGQASAFNVAIPQLSGSIVAFLDADDWWAKGKLSAVNEVFEANPTLAAVGHGFFEVHDLEAPREKIVSGQNCRLDLSSVDSARLASSGLTFLGTSRLSVRRKFFQKMGPIPEELSFCADLPILACALALGGAIILDRPLCYYRIHPANMCSHSQTDIAKVRRNIQVTEFFLHYIPEKLAGFGIARDISAVMLGTIKFEVERLKAQFGVATRSQVFRTELQRFRAYYQRPSLGYKLFECLVGACALTLPPRRFYQLLDWYSRNNFKRFRGLLGKAEPRVSPAFFQRLAVSERDLQSDRT